LAVTLLVTARLRTTTLTTPRRKLMTNISLDNSTEIIITSNLTRPTPDYTSELAQQTQFLHSNHTPIQKIPPQVHQKLLQAPLKRILLPNPASELPGRIIPVYKTKLRKKLTKS
jgi:hypothetical protein